MPAQFYTSVGSLAIQDRAGQSQLWYRVPVQNLRPEEVQQANLLPSRYTAAPAKRSSRCYCACFKCQELIGLHLENHKETTKTFDGNGGMSHGKNTKMIRKELTSPTFPPLPVGSAGMRHGHGTKRQEIDCTWSLPDARASLQPFSRPNKEPPL